MLLDFIIMFLFSFTASKTKISTYNKYLITNSKDARKTLKQNVLLTLSQLGIITCIYMLRHFTSLKNKKINVILEIFDFHVFAALG